MSKCTRSQTSGDVHKVNIKTWTLSCRQEQLHTTLAVQTKTELLWHTFALPERKKETFMINAQNWPFKQQIS